MYKEVKENKKKQTLTKNSPYKTKEPNNQNNHKTSTIQALGDSESKRMEDFRI